MTSWLAAMVLGVLAVLGGVAPVLAQRAPRAPARPATPVEPPAPPMPALPTPMSPTDPTALAARDLSMALLLVNPRDRSVDTIVLRLADSLLAITRGSAGVSPPAGGPGRVPDTARLAALLALALRDHTTTTEQRDRLARELHATLAERHAKAGELTRALARVREALAAAGVGAPDIILLDGELRRLVDR